MPRKPKTLIRKQFAIYPEQNEWLQKESERRICDEVDIIRQLIDEARKAPSQ